MKTALKATWMTWSANNGTCQNILGYIVLEIQHMTLPQVLPCNFYVFKDFTSPDILLSYPASTRLGIVEFTVPSEAPRLSSNDRHYHKSQNSHLQPTNR